MEPWDRRFVLARVQTIGVDEIVAETEPSAAVADRVVSGLEFGASRGVGMPWRLVFRRAEGEPTFTARYIPPADALIIVVGDVYWEAPEEEMENFFRQRIFPSANPDFPVLHELGHRAHYLALGDPARWSAYRAMRLSRPERRIVDAEVGRNAASDPLELIADVFAARLDGRTFNASVMALYRRYGGPTP
jgi:hypothetical protein